MDPKANTDPFASIAQPAQADPFASIAQTTGNTLPASSPSMFDRVANFGASVGQGVAQAGLSTVEGASKLLNKIPVVGETLAPSAGVAAMPGFAKAATDTPNMQKIEQESPTASKVGNFAGKTAEDIGEFMLGDEALKSLSLGKRAIEAAGLAEKYEKASPFVRKAIEHTMNAIRQGTTAGAETTVKTGDVKQGAEAGVAAAGGSAVLGAATDVLGKGVGYIRAAKNFKELPAALDKGITETVSQKAVVDGLKATAGTTAAEHLEDSALQYKTRAKAAYQMVDNAVNGELQPIQDKLSQTKKAITVNSNLNPELADKLKIQKGQLEKQLADTIEKAKSNGVPDADKVIEGADRDYNKFQAQSQLSVQLSRKGTETGVASPAGMHVWARNLDTPKVVGQTSRLEQALGKDGAEAIRKQTAEGLAKSKEFAEQMSVGKELKKSVAKGVGYAAGAGGIGGTGYLGYRVLSGH